MLGWELRELRLRVTKDNKISKSSQMRNKTNRRKNQKKVTKISQISPGEGLRGLMKNSGDSGRDSGRDSGELKRGTQTTHFGELRKELRGHLPSGHGTTAARSGGQGTTTNWHL